MKKELPIAVILLAFGIWSWMQFPTDSNAAGQRVASEGMAYVDDANDPSSVEGEPTDNEVVVATLFNQPAGDALPSDQKAVVQASWQTAAEATETKNDSTGMRAFAPAEFLGIAIADDEAVTATTALIRRIADGLNQLPAFATHTKINSRLFGVSMTAKGKYFQTAGGQKSRMEIQCHAPVAQTVLHMSDGRFVYILKSNHQQQRLEFIDLFRLANRRGTAVGGLLPTTWVMGGGIGEAIAHYADAFDFRAVSETLELQAKQDLIILRGIWKAETLLHLIHAHAQLRKRPTKVVWSEVPRQLPHAIELTFTTAAGESATPKQISFFQFESDENISAAKEMLRVEFSPLEFRNGLPDELFTLESTDFEAVDVTKIYNAKIAQLSEGMDKVANQATPTADLR